MVDFLNQDDFAESVVDSTLDTLGDQADAEGLQQLDGRIEINPQQFAVLDNADLLKRLLNTPRNLWETFSQDSKSQEKKHLVLGPFFFSQKFDKAPRITYGQQPGGVVQPGAAMSNNYIPFLVQAYTYQLEYTNGVVAGFYVGLYALTSPPPNVTSHSIDWIASGTASRYSDAAVEESWSDGYDYNDTEFLVDDTGFIE